MTAKREEAIAVFAKQYLPRDEAAKISDRRYEESRWQ
jgi:hypothetical protein